MKFSLQKGLFLIVANLAIVTVLFWRALPAQTSKSSPDAQAMPVVETARLLPPNGPLATVLNKTRALSNVSVPVVNINSTSQHLAADQHVSQASKSSISDPCSVLTPPDPKKLSRGKFFPVNPKTRKTFVFAAYYDPRFENRPQIRVIGMSMSGGAFCQVWYPGEKKVRVLMATPELSRERHGRKYTSAVFVCALPRMSSLPYAVSLVEGKCDVPRHYLAVIVNSAGPVRSEPRLNFTVCVTPLNFHFDNTHQLVEMIEMNRLLGADRLVFYNHTSGAALTRYLSYYTSVLGVTDVIQWDVPVPVDVWPPDPHLEPPQIHYFAQLVALNDCLFRYMFVSRYVVFTDLDEFVVPQQVSSWSDLLPSLPCDQSATGAFSFMCTFFRTDWPDDSNSTQDNVITELKLNTQLKSLREHKVWPHSSRSKTIVKPETIREMGIHNINGFLGGHRMCHVTATHALLYHYRRWDDEKKPSGVIDKHMFAYKDGLVSRCMAVHKAVASISNQTHWPSV